MNAPILKEVLSSSKLPTLPAVAVKLLELTRDPEVDLGDIAELVQYDQALSAKILRTVNSSYYHLAQPCPTIRRALAYLGLSTVKSLVLGFCLVDLTKKCDQDFDLLDYWRRCVYSAAAARRIAMVTQSCNPDEAFLAALMQDVGMLAMHAVLGADYDALISQTNGNHLMLPHSETTALGFTHAEAGAKLGELWALPEQLVEPIRHHHHRGTSAGRYHALINAVILAYRISNLISCTDRKSALDMISAMSLSLFHISPEDERTILLETTQDAEELSGLLEVKVGELPDFRSILAEADDALVEHELDLQRAGEAGTNGTPGVGNREHFDQELASRFQQARSQGSALGLILVDADRFESLNETLGPEAGDTVLRALARRLRVSIGGAGLVCRYGSEAFAVLLPEATRMEAARVAERLRRAIEQEHIDLRKAGTGEDVALVTASFGVAALEPALVDQLDRPELLLQLADRALAAAKLAGQNCVRVFTPRSPNSTAA